MASNAMNMGEKDILEDFLTSQKQISASYNSFAGECEHVPLRNAFLNILREEQEIQTQLFDEMQNHGWYQVKAADQQQIDTLKNKFNIT